MNEDYSEIKKKMKIDTEGKKTKTKQTKENPAINQNKRKQISKQLQNKQKHFPPKVILLLLLRRRRRRLRRLISRVRLCVTP